MTRASRWHALRQWLDPGAPRGVPRQDLLGIFGLLRQDLTDTELDDVRHRLVTTARSEHRPIDDDDIRAAIVEVVHPSPDELDVYRVREALARTGTLLQTHL